MNPVTEKLLESALETAVATNADAILLYADVCTKPRSLQGFIDDAGDVRVVLATRCTRESCELPSAEMVTVPDVKLTRLGQIKVAVLLSLNQGVLSKGDRIVCLTGIAGTGTVDTIHRSRHGRQGGVPRAASTWGRLRARYPVGGYEEFPDRSCRRTIGSPPKEIERWPASLKSW